MVSATNLLILFFLLSYLIIYNNRTLLGDKSAMARVQVGESMAMAVSSLWSSKLRTFLTLLGIIIGVLTIIAVVSIIQGLNNYVYTKMAFFGANDFSVSKFSFIGGNLSTIREQMKRKDLRLECTCSAGSARPVSWLAHPSAPAVR